MLQKHVASTGDNIPSMSINLENAFCFLLSSLFQPTSAHNVHCSDMIKVVFPEDNDKGLMLY